jgi:hypothetical protein
MTDDMCAQRTTLRGITCPYEAYQQIDRSTCDRGYKACNKAPAPVKPCRGEKRREQGFCGTRPWRYCHELKSIKDTKKYFKKMFFMGQ